jgi:hypothetical protein
MAFQKHNIRAHLRRTCRNRQTARSGTDNQQIT